MKMGKAQAHHPADKVSATESLMYVFDFTVSWPFIRDLLN